MSDGAAGALEDIGRMTALGVETFMFQLANPNEVNATLDNMDRFAETVMSKA